MTRTEEVMQAFKGLLDAATLAGDLPSVGRDENTFKRLADWSVGSLTGEVGIALFDGNAADPDERLSPNDHELEHTAEVEILVFGADRVALFDYLLETVGAIVAANAAGDVLPWDFVQCRIPQRDYPAADSHDLGKSCVLPIVFTFRSEQPF